MKRVLFSLLSTLCVCIASCILTVGASAQTGAWNGDIDLQGTKLPLVFHLDDENPCMDSPAQGAKGIPMQFTRIEPDSIVIQIPMIGGSFEGKLKDGQLRGVFSQRGFKFPLVLSQGEKTVNRPQNPLPPFPYSQEEVSFTNGDAVLKGTLTLPEGYDRDTPVVLMVTGSGQQNRDEEVFDHRPFAVIADALARKGTASLRYDDRGCAESTGDLANATTEVFMNDALAGIELLRKRFNKVGVLGHSEGGTIGLMLGENQKVDFIINLAGMAVSGKETLLDQNRHALTQAGYPQQVIEDYCALLDSAFDGEGNVAEQIGSSNLPAELQQNLRQVLLQINMPYFKYFIALDPSKHLHDITCPVLALNGTKDTQVSHEKNLAALRKGLPENPKNLIIAVPDLNHLFQRCQTGMVTEYATIEETISPEVLETIINWIHNL